MHGDLFDFRSPWESGQLVENIGKVGTWRLLHRLVAHHVDLVVEIATNVVWGVWIPASSASSFFISATLAIGVVRQVRIALVGGFAILSDAVVANMKDLAPEPRREEGQLEIVSVEPSEYDPGLSSKMSWMESSRIW